MNRWAARGEGEHLTLDLVEPGPVGTPRANCSGREYRASLPGYLGSITSIDDNFGRLMKTLDSLGLSDNTIVVVTSDHGEMMGSHGRMQKHIWYEEAINIPHIVGWPGKIPAGTTDAVFNQVDMLPTCLGLMGMPIPTSIEGKDFSPLCRGENMRTPGSALVMYDDEGGKKQSFRTVRTRRYSYTVAEGQGEVTRILYDLEKDPYQQKNLVNKESIRKALESELHAHLKATKDPFAKFMREPPAWMNPRGIEENSGGNTGVRVSSAPRARHTVGRAKIQPDSRNAAPGPAFQATGRRIGSGGARMRNISISRRDPWSS